MKRRKLSRPKHRPSTEIDSLPSPSSLASSSQPGLEKLPTSLTDYIVPDKPPKPPQTAYRQLTSPLVSSSHPVPEHNYLNLHEYNNLTRRKSDENDNQNISDKGIAVTSRNRDDAIVTSSQTNGNYHEAGSDEEETTLPLSDLDIQKICSEIVSTLGNMGANIADISSSGKYKREGNCANLAVSSRTSTPVSEDRVVSPASSRNCSVHSLHSSSEHSLVKQTVDNTHHHVITNTPGQFVNKELINKNYSVSLSSQLSAALSTSLPCSGDNPVLSPRSSAITTAYPDHVTTDSHPLSTGSERDHCSAPAVRYSLDKPPKHPQKPLRYIRKRSLKFKRVKRKVKKQQHIIDSSTVTETSCGQSRSLLIAKLISLYRNLQQRSKLLEVTSSKSKPDFPPKSRDTRTCVDLDDVTLLQRYMNTCYQMLKQQLSTYNKKILLEREVKVFQVDDIPTRVDSSRHMIRGSTLPPDTLFEYLFRKEPVKPSALAVKYNRHVRIPSQNVCQRIFNEVPVTIGTKTIEIPPAADQGHLVCHSEGPADIDNSSSCQFPSHVENFPNHQSEIPATTDNNRQSPTFEFSQQCFTTSTTASSCRSQVKTYRVTERLERSNGVVSVREHYVTAVSWINNNKIYVGVILTLTAQHD